MATIILQAAGAALGSYFGAAGSIIGKAVGAAAGFALDNRLFGSSRSVEGPRLGSSQILSSDEGATIPRLYGRARLSGQLIWATRFEEVQETEKQGGKGGGGSKVTTYSYFANFAIGICEGEISGIKRIWADGKALDPNALNIRVYKGTEDQQPDLLIEAKQGAENTPAYRGLAYVVFERLPLEDFGNRIPQLTFEVTRPIGVLEREITAVTIIPGASEFAYDPSPVIEQFDPVSSDALNVHTTFSGSDWEASINELQELCPNLDRVALVVAWFGDDLRAGHCTCKPKVEVSSRDIVDGQDWFVSGLSRSRAELVSQIEGRPALGGTPNDAAVIRAINDLNSRGLKVTLYPFLMMDVPPENNLPDPYGADQQSAFPWRGRITCHPHKTEIGTSDRTPQAGSEVAAFLGNCVASDFSQITTGVQYSGPKEWSYRRFILHYANLCKVAGGVDTFLVGSEMRELSTIRDAQDGFPFVTGLSQLAAEVRAVLGPETDISYAADWSEYFGYHPQDGSNDHFFHLDPFWSDTNVTFVGIDNYMPLSDWRDNGDPAGPHVGTAPTDIAMLRANVAGGEGYDWYYLNEEERRAGIRTAITDGAGKPWVFRYKDLKGWWGNQHFNREGGVEVVQPTGWMPQSKPLRFTEYGCPAIDRGANQPNVFVDPKSSESFLPYFSSGQRDDFVQRAFLQAHHSHWNENHADFEDGNNPQSNLYAGRMVDASANHVWTWDARPYPMFPDYQDVWTDGANWHLGHWLNGRLGGSPLADLIAAILTDHGFLEFDVSRVSGQVDGYVVGDLNSARQALEILIEIFSLTVFENGETVVFESPGLKLPIKIEHDDLVDRKDEPMRTITRIQETDLPLVVSFDHIDPRQEYRSSVSTSRRIEGNSERHTSLSAPLVVSPASLLPETDMWLQRKWAGRETLRFEMGPAWKNIQTGDVLEFEPHDGSWMVEKIEDSNSRIIEARSHDTNLPRFFFSPDTSTQLPSNTALSKPHVIFLDLPILTGNEPLLAPKVAVSQRPWPGRMAAAVSPSDDGFAVRTTIELCASTGKLLGNLESGSSTGRWDWSTTLDVKLFKGALASQPKSIVLNGTNVAAVRSANGGFEVIQFLNAELIGDRTWRLSGLLRGQAGTDPEMHLGADVGSDFAVLDRSVAALTLSQEEVGLELNWRVGPANRPVSDPTFDEQRFTGGLRALQPLKPVHISAAADLNGDLKLSWVRRTRINGDNWSGVEVPLGETSERYRASVEGGGIELRVWETNSPNVTYAADFLTVDRQVSESLVFGVAQISDDFGAGPAAFHPI